MPHHSQLTGSEGLSLFDMDETGLKALGGILLVQLAGSPKHLPINALDESAGGGLKGFGVEPQASVERI